MQARSCRYLVVHTGFAYVITARTHVLLCRRLVEKLELIKKDKKKALERMDMLVRLYAKMVAMRSCGCTAHPLVRGAVTRRSRLSAVAA